MFKDLISRIISLTCDHYSIWAVVRFRTIFQAQVNKLNTFKYFIYFFFNSIKLHVFPSYLLKSFRLPEMSIWIRALKTSFCVVIWIVLVGFKNVINRTKLGATGLDYHNVRVTEHTLFLTKQNWKESIFMPAKWNALYFLVAFIKIIKQLLWNSIQNNLLIFTVVCTFNQSI